MTQTVHVEVRPGAYADSVTLLQVSRDVALTPGVVAAQVAMATPLNLEVLEGMGFEIPGCSPNDMIVALRVESVDDVETAVAAVGATLAASTRRHDPSERDVPPRTTRSALRGDADLAIVSVPGPHALVEAMDALDAGRDVLIFSDNVPLAHEVALKRTAAERGLLVMGPDCGTAVVGGVGLGFANATRPGPVGIVAASGTGCQQLMCLLEAAGVGVSAALGVGGRDLGSEVAGSSTRTALRRLDDDPDVTYIVLVSKPPADEIAADIEAFAASLSTPVGFSLLGAGRTDLTRSTETVLHALGVEVPTWPRWGTPATALRSGRVRGLFVGGTLASETAQIIAEVLGPDGTVGTEPGALVADTHAVVDFGDDTLTQGRAHPMIDPSLRLD